MSKAMIPDQDRLETLKSRLGLRPLDGEGGFFTEAYVSHLMVEATDGPSPASNCIYYALTNDQPQNHLHHLVSDDYHVLIEGGPADYYIFHPEGTAEFITLGSDLEAGQKMVVPTPANCWKAIRLNHHANYVLIGSVVTPAWNSNQITIGAGQSFIDIYTGKADWATQEFLRSLIGPNWEKTPT
jgi:uncharacterized protein